MCGNTRKTEKACEYSKKNSLFFLKFLLPQEKYYTEIGKLKFQGISLFEIFRMYSKALENSVAKKSPAFPYW